MRGANSSSLSCSNAFVTLRSCVQVDADSGRDKWFTPKTAMEYGIIDQVIKVRRPAFPCPSPSYPHCTLSEMCIEQLFQPHSLALHESTGL